MSNQLLERCPECNLILLSGAIFDAAEKSDRYGAILGINRDADINKAIAGYVGLGSAWLGDDPNSRNLYRCPRCQTDCLRSMDD